MIFTGCGEKKGSVTVSDKNDYLKSKMNKYLEEMGCLNYLSKKIDRSFGCEE